MSDRLDDELSQSMRSEIEMEGATIKGAMPTFKNLTKQINFRQYKRSPDAFQFPTGQIFTLPTGQEVVLVPEEDISKFLLDKTVEGKDDIDARERWEKDRIRYGDRGVFEDRYNDEFSKDNFPGYNDMLDKGVNYRRVMRPEAAAAHKKAIESQILFEPTFPVHHLGNGFFVVLGASQQYQPDKDSFGSFEMTADGPVRVDEREPETKSIPIVFYSDPNKPIEYEAHAGFDREKHRAGLDPHIYETRTLPSLAMKLLTPDDMEGRTPLRRKGYNSTSDTGVMYYNVPKSDMKPDLIPDFTARDIIEGYKAAKEASKYKPAQEVKAVPPVPPAPAPEPRPKPTSSFDEFEMPIEDTPKGRRRVPERRFDERQDLTDDYLTNMMRFE